LYHAGSGESAMPPAASGRNSLDSVRSRGRPGPASGIDRQKAARRPAIRSFALCDVATRASVSGESSRYHGVRHVSREVPPHPTPSRGPSVPACPVAGRGRGGPAVALHRQHRRHDAPGRPRGRAGQAPPYGEAAPSARRQRTGRIPVSVAANRARSITHLFKRPGAKAVPVAAPSSAVVSARPTVPGVRSRSATALRIQDSAGSSGVNRRTESGRRRPSEMPW
jgi:hypothetical protein